MTAPQRPLRPLLPNNSVHPTPPPTVKKKKIKVACKPCAQKKCRCDSARPTCSTCESQSIKCFYDVAEGDSRHRSLKKKHAALQRDLGSTLELIWHIQHAPDVDAQTIFSRLREGGDPSAILAAVKAPERCSQQNADLTSSYKLTGIPDLSDSAPLAATLRSHRHVLMEAFSIFLKCTATIFHIYTQEDVNLLLTESLQTKGQVPLSTLCEACGVAAVGSRFSRSKISPEMGEYFFSVTKQLLDECIDKTPLQGMKVCALLAMCNIVNKATAAFAYVELGLGVARLKGLLERKPHSHLDYATWLESKKVAKSLLLCRGWLQATLSYVPEAKAPISLEDVDEDECCLDCGDHVLYQTQVARLTVIKAGIFQQMGTSDFSRGSSEAVRSALQQWLDQVPEQIRLENLDKPTVNPEARISGLYLHSFYLGGKMLVYRWILSWIILTRRTGTILPPADKTEAARCAEDGVLAAREAAKTLYTIYKEGGAVRHCWLCIFQAYLSCCILTYDVLQGVLHGQPTSYHDNLELASLSLDVLAWTGELDATGKQYHTSLKPIYTLVSSLTMRPREPPAYTADDHVHFRETHGTSPLHEATQQLSQMLYVALRPDKERGQMVSSYRPNMEDTATSLDEVGLGVHLYWAMEFEADGAKLENKDILRDSSPSDLVLPPLRGQFAGGILPDGWTTTRPFVDPVLTKTNTTDIF